ncbi:MAG: phage holin family protein [Pseudonocardia sp.]|nr:phage holin family protein [Pseudonocardia sp.]
MTAHTPSQATPTGPSLSSDPANATTGELITRLSSQVSELVRGEIALAKAELTQKGKRAGIGAGLAGTAGVLALYGVGALITTVIAALALVLPVWAAALIVAVVIFIIAGVLGLLGKSQIQRATPPVPEITVESVKRDVATLTERIKR